MIDYGAPPEQPKQYNVLTYNHSLTKTQEEPYQPETEAPISYFEAVQLVSTFPKALRPKITLCRQEA